MIDIWRTRFDGFNNYYHNILLAASEQQLLQWTTQLSEVKDISELLGAIPEKPVVSSTKSIALINLLETKFGALSIAHLKLLRTATADETNKLLQEFFRNKSSQQIINFLIARRKKLQKLQQYFDWITMACLAITLLLILSPFIILVVLSIIAPNTPDLGQWGAIAGFGYFGIFFFPLLMLWEHEKEKQLVS